MSGLFRKLMLVAGIGMIGMAFPGGANAAPMGSYQPSLADHGGSFTLAGNGSRYGDTRDGYTTVIVTNRGQNGYPDHVVKQRVRCWSQYYDGYRQRIAKC
ncbi:MAG: hypothetical protein LCH93_07120 [Proteobacteria bacterium]|nr:hypothetical protein [Pseudomonadota bacterium]